MSVTIQCPRCEAVMTGEDEDDLVAKVQAHVRDDHKLGRILPRKHILYRLRAHRAGRG